MTNIGKRIKELRKQNNLTQERLADYIGVTDKAVSKWECGLTVPDLGLIVPLSRVLHVTVDELRCGKQEEVDIRRAEFDKHCSNILEYNKEENYQLALQAVAEFPGDYKYLNWLASAEFYMSSNDKFKEDPAMEHSIQMLEKSLERCNTVIAECSDEMIRSDAIWNAMLCCKYMNQYDEAKKYANMYPERTITRDSAMEMCLEGEELLHHHKNQVFYDLYKVCLHLSRIYYFSEKASPDAEEAMNTTEAFLKTVFPNGKYYGFYGCLCGVYQKRAEFATLEGDYTGAVNYLKIMLDYAKQITNVREQYVSGVLDGLTIRITCDQLYYHMVGLDDSSKSTYEILQKRMKCMDIFSPLWQREDFKVLLDFDAEK